MDADTNLSAKDLVALYVNQATMRELDLEALGRLHRELRRAMQDVEDALAPKIAAGAARGATYVELAMAAGYGSTTTIVRIVKDQGASPGRGSNHKARRRRLSA